MTNQPVRVLVHAHWHPDHLINGGEFRTAFPGIAFVSPAYTQKLQALQFARDGARAAVAKHVSLEDARKQIDLSEFQKKFCGTDHDREIAFKMGFTDQVIERAYEEAKFLAED